MSGMNDFIGFLEKLEERKIYYKLNKTRTETIIVEIAVPGQRWEVEFNTYGSDSSYEIEIEKFLSDGTIYGAEEIETLFREFSD